jgi:chromosome segregation ATPase
MSEKVGGSFSVETYITKQEGLLMEHIRRLLQTETKVVLLESALQEMYKKNEELTSQIDSYKSNFDQSVNGLQNVTIERDRLQTKIKELEGALNSCNDQKTTATNKMNDHGNRVLILEEDIKQLNSRVQTAANDYSTLKENYNKVLAALEDANKKLESVNEVKVAAPKKEKKSAKRSSDTESEWIDGEYKIST